MSAFFYMEPGKEAVNLSAWGIVALGAFWEDRKVDGRDL